LQKEIHVENFPRLQKFFFLSIKFYLLYIIFNTALVRSYTGQHIGSIYESSVSSPKPTFFRRRVLTQKYVRRQVKHFFAHCGRKERKKQRRLGVIVCGIYTLRSNKKNRTRRLIFLFRNKTKRKKSILFVFVFRTCCSFDCVEIFWQQAILQIVNAIFTYWNASEIQ
jgi:hypothetical protein